MIRKISTALAAALVLGSASIATAATVKSSVARQHPNRNSVMLLEDGARVRGPRSGVDFYAEQRNYIDKQNVWR
jgi:hypothetical protein